MRDITDRDIQVGDFIVYSGGYHTCPDLCFGWVRKMNPKTDKLWVEHANWDRTQAMKQTYDRTIDKWVDTNEPRGVSIVNHTQDARFMIMP
jgi:hypothetical protein